MYSEERIKHERADFWVLDVGHKGFEVYKRGLTHSKRVASIGKASERCKNLGLPRAIAECDKRQADLDRQKRRPDVL